MSTHQQNDPSAPAGYAAAAIHDAAMTESSRPIRWLGRALPLAILLLVGILAAREVRGLDLHAIRSVLGALSLPQLLLIQGLALTGVLVMSLYDWQAARSMAIRIAPRTLVVNAWIANAFNNLIGLSGLAGSGIRMVLMAGERVDARRAAAFAALIMVSVPVGLAVLCWALLLAGAPDLNGLPIPAWTAWLALGAFAVYPLAYVFLLQRGALTRVLRGLAPQSLRSLLTMIAISTLDWLLAASVAWVALTFSGAPIPWLHFLFGFVLASSLGILSLIPGGLGVFDTALVILLAPFVPGPEHIVSGLLLYRLCYYLVPWLIAVYLGSDKLMLSEQWQHMALARLWRENRLLELLRLPLNLMASLGVRALAYLSFGGGIVLLVSAAFPALQDRLTVLRAYLPLAAIEISHLLSVIAGVLLIALARGIAGQVRSAYTLTQILLLGGAFFTFLKGIDYEEAIALLLVALLLHRQRSRFYRDSYPLLSPRSLIWLVGLICSVIGFAWLGDWVHGAIPLGWQHLARSGAGLEAPRFARGLLAAAGVAAAFIGWSFFQRPKIVPAGIDRQTLVEAETILNRFGGSEFAHLVFLGDKSLLWSPDRTAFIQYAMIRDRLIALGDPCGNPAAFDTVLIAFRDYADRHGLTPCLYEVSEAHLHHYHDAGFALFKLGEAAVVELADFTLEGKRGAALRHSINRAKRSGAEFALLEQPLEEPLWATLRALSDRWLMEREAAEKGFSLGNFNEAYLRRSPIAIIEVKGRVVAFANLMPDYGRHEELSVDLMRHYPDAPPGTMDLLFVELILYARAQGYTAFNLGMAPLGGVGETRYARAGEKIMRLAFEYGNRFYNYKGLRDFKEKFHPRWRSTYFAYPLLTALPPLLMDSAALIAGGYRRILFRSEPKHACLTSSSPRKNTE
ncbi:MAG: bifunctional lysylphosphatidylglycerol flippase/synthetase MprF [Porticoccaceae bacterium]